MINAILKWFKGPEIACLNQLDARRWSFVADGRHGYAEYGNCIVDGPYVEARWSAAPYERCGSAVESALLPLIQTRLERARGQQFVERVRAAAIEAQKP